MSDEALEIVVPVDQVIQDIRDSKPSWAKVGTSHFATLKTNQDKVIHANYNIPKRKKYFRLAQHYDGPIIPFSVWVVLVSAIVVAGMWWMITHLL